MTQIVKIVELDQLENVLNEGYVVYTNQSEYMIVPTYRRDIEPTKEELIELRELINKKIAEVD